jgi:hypothetical protein
LTRGKLAAAKTVKIIKIISIIATIAFLGVIAFFVWFGIAWSRGEKRAAQDREDMRSGKWDFGDQPALFAVAQAIVRNDPEAIRIAAKNVPDLNAAGRDGTTLLYFAVKSTWQHEYWVESVKTLISLGANPNYNNGQAHSFALAQAVEASAIVLRAMLDGGGDPNGRDKNGVPIIFSNWDVGHYTDSQYRSRFTLLLEHGADINATMPETGCCGGYSLVLNVTDRALNQERNYEDALHLLELGADPNRVAADGMTLATKLTARQEKFAREKKAPPREFERLWEWAKTHGILPQPN